MNRKLMAMAAFAIALSGNNVYSKPNKPNKPAIRQPKSKNYGNRYEYADGTVIYAINQKNADRKYYNKLNIK